VASDIQATWVDGQGAELTADPGQFPPWAGFDELHVEHPAALLLVLPNPFLLTIYLVDVFEKLERRQSARVMFRAALIAMAVYCCFAAFGEAIFSRVIQAEVASFQIFGAYFPQVRGLMLGDYFLRRFR